MVYFMKKTFLSFSLLGIVVFITVLSCSKNYSNNSTVYSPQSLNQLFAGLRSTPQSLSVQAGRDTIIFGANGTMLHFYTNSFKTASGTIITSGTINLQLVEMYKAGDMIRNRATTMVSGQILQSAGQVTIDATMNGQEVFANVYGIGFKHGSSSNAPMAIYYGSTGNADSVATWAQSDTTKQGTKVNGTRDSSLFWASNFPYFSFDSSTVFHWVNCDWFYSNDSPKVSVNVILPDTSFHPRNTQIFLVLPFVSHVGAANDTLMKVLCSDRGGIAYTAATNTMELTSDGSSIIVPAGLHYELVVITNKNGTYYYYSQAGVIPHNGLVATAAMSTDSPGDIIARLEGM